MNLTQSQNMVVCGSGGTLLCNHLSDEKKYLILPPFPTNAVQHFHLQKDLTRPIESNGTFSHSNPIHLLTNIRQQNVKFSWHDIKSSPRSWTILVRLQLGTLSLKKNDIIWEFFPNVGPPPPPPLLGTPYPKKFFSVYFAF